jgi:hypothetical protein
MEEIKVIELIIDEENEISGIDAISIVDDPAIQEDFIMLSSQEVKLAEVDKEKKILMGPALIPNKKIYRRTGNDEYYIYFSEDTVRKASELFLTKGYQNNATLEHDGELEGLSVVESWIIDDTNQDKSRKYGFDLPNGTWMVSMKVYDESLWSNYVKTGKVKGFSIEGHFADAMERPKEQLPEYGEEELEALSLIEELTKALDVELRSYDDYPKAARENARKVLDWRNRYGRDEVKGMTRVGWRRANQLSKGQKITRQTIARMASFNRHRRNATIDPDLRGTPWKDKGYVAWLGWGGTAGVNWAIRKMKQFRRGEFASMVIGDDMAIIDDRLAYATKELAEKAAQDIGCEGHHTHEFEGKTWYMPCEQHKLEDLAECPKGYKKVYGKCVKMAEVGPRGGVKSSPKAPKSDTPNPRPKGEGSAKGDASGKTGAKVSQKDRASLQKKADEFNEKYKGKLGYGVTVGVLSSVFQRGLGAFNTSRSPVVKSASQWAFARVNAFLYLVKNGRPQNAKYTTDYDLLPKKHPKSSK